MRCPSLKQWPLFYYNELNPKQLKKLDQHLKLCRQCQSYYAKLSDLFSIPLDAQPAVSESEFRRIIKEVVQEADGSWGILERLREQSRDFIQAVKAKFFIQPRLALVTVTLLLLILIIPLHQQQVMLDEGIFELEMELVVGEDELDTFLDFYNSPEQSQKLSSTVISS